ncbi:MAG: exodeoxyribonuclease V subunit gamma [Treponema sp.]|jgi:exodeoxyribonuclease V gamma subunit|nr:exodeoxyribonuclease V subunit gamma [Treponema sp.]
MIIHANTCIENLTKQFLNDVLDKENFEGMSASKGSFLTGGSIIVCESRGLQEYIQKTCAAYYGIWTALSFKPLAGLLMQCAYNLSKDKKDESDNVFNRCNLIWAIYRLLEGEKKTYFFTSELASLFFAYQIYRPDLINNWNNGKQYLIPDADSNFINNEKFQRDLWLKLKKEYRDEQDITQLYKLFSKSDKNVLPKQIFIFCPISIAPVQLKALEYLSEAGCKVNIYINQISNEYFSGQENHLLSGLGKSAKYLYEQIGWENLEHDMNIDSTGNSTPKTLLKIIQDSIFSDTNIESINLDENLKDKSFTANSCFSELREVEVLCDYILDLFDSKNLTPQDIAVVSPDIEKYANAIESVFGRYNIPIIIADRDVKKHNKTAQLLNLLFSLAGSRYEASDIAALYEYSLYVQDKERDSNDIEYLKKCIKENAVRYGFDNPGNPPNYSFKTGFEQLSAGFFMITESGFSENDYCYPDIEGNYVDMLGDFADFVKSLQKFEEESGKEKTINDWDDFFRENLKSFFGTDEMDFNEEDENPYQTVIGAWDSLKKEMLIGFGGNENYKIGFPVLKMALQNNLEGQAKYSYTLSGRISFSNIDTIRAVPHKVICCIGMNNKEYPRQNIYKEISLMPDKKLGDKDIANEDRLIFLQTLCSAKENFYISWIGQNENTMDDLEPSSVVVMLLKYFKKIITKYPLQPFSKKYINGELETYDVRWNIENEVNSFDIWKWRVEKNDKEEKNSSIDNLFYILKDAPKYFIKNICNINLPENTDLLENLEPFSIESALDKWILSDMIINDDNLNYINEIEIMKRRGELPDGIYAEHHINKIIGKANELKYLAKEEPKGTYWIYPSKDKGKYRLKHWLYHLDLNLNKENQNTKMFLKDKEPVIIKLKGMSKKAAKTNLDKLRQLAEELEYRLLPVFPDTAWKYINEGKIEEVDAFINYSQYAKMAFRNINTIEGEIKKEFIDYSKILFNDYTNYIEASHEDS